MSKKLKKKIINFIYESNIDCKKISWLNKKEAIQITFIIIFTSIIISLLLWIIDRIIFYIIALIIKLRF
ncbi:preprotein translocase subunit SecE [Buchnera aphidicola]